MATTVQLEGGNFQDALGNILANGYLLLELSADAQANSTTQVISGKVLKVPLDVNGRVIVSPAIPQIWPNASLTPAGTFYKVSIYNSSGQLVGGPNSQTVGTSNPFDVGTWVPNVL